MIKTDPDVLHTINQVLLEGLKKRVPLLSKIKAAMLWAKYLWRSRSVLTLVLEYTSMGGIDIE